MPKRRYVRDSHGRFASTGSSGATPQGKNSPSNAYLNRSRKPMTVGEHRAFVRKKIADGSMTKESYAAVMKQSKETGIPIRYRTELGPRRRPSDRVTIGRDKQGNRITARSRIVTGKTIDGKFVPNEKPPAWKKPAKPRTRKTK